MFVPRRGVSGHVPPITTDNARAASQGAVRERNRRLQKGRHCGGREVILIAADCLISRGRDGPVPFRTPMWERGTSRTQCCSIGAKTSPGRPGTVGSVLFNRHAQARQAVMKWPARRPCPSPVSHGSIALRRFGGCRSTCLPVCTWQNGAQNCEVKWPYRPEWFLGGFVDSGLLDLDRLFRPRGSGVGFTSYTDTFSLVG